LAGIVMVKKFFVCRSCSSSTARSSVGPSAPQFQLREELVRRFRFDPEVDTRLEAFMKAEPDW
jgi:hypothetical protein